MTAHRYRRRNNMRLPFYDYSQYGCYFVTICTKERRCLFGNIQDGEMRLNELGNIVKNGLLSVLSDYPKSEFSHYVVMPNHLQFIWFNRDGVDLSHIVKLIKGRISFQYGQYAKENNIEKLPLWQRSFYEHIIRNEEDFLRIWEYIENNPLQWELDRFNPKNIVQVVRAG